MSGQSGRSVLRSIVGWVIVAVIAYWLLGFVIGTVRFIFKFVVWIVIIGGLVYVYFKLQDDDED